MCFALHHLQTESTNCDYLCFGWCLLARTESWRVAALLIQVAPVGAPSFSCAESTVEVRSSSRACWEGPLCSEWALTWAWMMGFVNWNLKTKFLKLVVVIRIDLIEVALCFGNNHMMIFPLLCGRLSSFFSLPSLPSIRSR